MRDCTSSYSITEEWSSKLSPLQAEGGGTVRAQLKLHALHYSKRSTTPPAGTHAGHMRGAGLATHLQPGAACIPSAESIARPCQLDKSCRPLDKRLLLLW